MRVLTSIFILFLIFLFNVETHAQSSCKAVQLEFYPDAFAGILEQGTGGKLRKNNGDGKRNPSMAFHIEYKIVKNINYNTTQNENDDIVLFSTDGKKCYTKKDISNDKFYSLKSMKGSREHFFATLCFENEVNLSDYYIIVSGSAFGWDERRYARKERYRNEPNCSISNNGSEKSGNFYIRYSLASLNNVVNFPPILLQIY
jgi:hypothetical protein